VAGAACLFTFPELSLVGEASAVEEVRFPYIPGYLSFREGPALIRALEKLRKPPDLLLIDGQGIAHPKRFGIASHLGVVLDMPSIGCAKSRLIGEYDEPGPLRGDWKPLIYKGNMVGAVLRTKDGVNPLFISPGHKTDLATSVEIVLACTAGYRIPEPVRRADSLSKQMKMSCPSSAFEQNGS
jgi:deoxyribonuclease V